MNQHQARLWVEKSTRSNLFGDFVTQTKEEKAAYCAAWRERNKDKIRAYNAQYRKDNPQLQRGYDLKRRFGITQADYDRMVVAQCGACQICGLVPSEDPDAPRGYRLLVVDHDHVTGKVRGLLCNNCNTMLGQAKDNIETLTKSIEYLIGASNDCDVEGSGAEASEAA